ncbi:MAG: tRNA modification GTPase [Endomicrobiia bacterium]|nr:tRNA modification GTPase [Endomicrobiia bacterium]
MYPTDDTIAALSTPPMPSAVAVIRISGPKATDILTSIFKPRRKVRMPLTPRLLTLGDVRDPRTGSLVDEVLAVIFKAPHSYTAEDSAEIHCHGNPFIARKILEIISSFDGVRMAERGEFTYRAFLNGKIALPQAEAVLAVIESKSDYALKVGLGQLKGKLAAIAGKWKSALVDIMSTIEAKLDYPEDLDGEAYKWDELGEKILAVKTDMENALEKNAGATGGEITVVITGKPNVGKSSLFNVLAREELAIVTPLSGTTTDTLSETLCWDGISWKIYDTAGLSLCPSSDIVEEMGRSRSESKIASAMAIIAVFDGSQALDEDDLQVARRVSEAASAGDLDTPGAEAHGGRRQGIKAVAVVNKSDLPGAFGDDELRRAFPTEGGAVVIVRSSAMKGSGIDDIKSALARLLSDSRNAMSVADDIIVANVRQKKALRSAVIALGEAAQTIRQAGENEEITAHHLQVAAGCLGEISGEIAPDDILSGIFSRFCVGK